MIRPERNEDINSIYEVNKAAFYSPDKPEGFNEWDFVNSIRDSKDFINDLSLVCEIENEILGHILFTEMTVGASDTKILCLGPMAVHPDHQKMGIGSRLINAGIGAAKDLGYEAIIVLGHKDYYPKFGFAEASNFKITLMGETCEYLFALELKENALKEVKGDVKYCDAFYDEDGNLL